MILKNLVNCIWTFEVGPGVCRMAGEKSCQDLLGSRGGGAVGFLQRGLRRLHVIWYAGPMAN